MGRLGMAVLALGVCLPAGCSFTPRALATGDAGADGPVGDAGTGLDGGAADAPRAADAAPHDASVPDATSCWPFTPTNFDPCSLPASNGSVVERMPYTFNTDTGVATFDNGTTNTPKSTLLPQAGATSIRVVVFDEYTVLAPLHIVGSHPLLVVSKDALEVGDVIDASASTGPDGVSTPGPGGNDAFACTASTGTKGDPGQGAAGSGGGGGGAFGAGGGHGGAGSGTGSGGGASGGAPSGSGVSPLRGGCAGGAGGGSGGGVGGAGGGAIQFEAQGLLVIELNGLVQASGAGGQRGSGSGGGGGAGAGGAVFLEAGQVQLIPAAGFSVAAVCANGGSGGEGGGTGSSANGAAGSCDPEVGSRTIDTSPTGGDGGDGSARDAPVGLSGFPALPDNAGGGGGGAGVGRVRIHSVFTPVVINAAVTPTPE
jgi:hypothetical protein